MGEAGLAASMPSFEGVSFHAQQAAEKALKGLLVRYQVEFDRMHNLEALLRLAEPVASGISQECIESTTTIWPSSTWRLRSWRANTSGSRHGRLPPHDSVYDGQVLRIAVSDIPERRTDLMAGS